MIRVTIAVYLPWEYCHGKHINCSKWEIHYTDDIARKKKFISFDHRRVTVESTKVWKNEN